MAVKATAKIQRTFKGTVVSDKIDKTIVVRVDSLKMHPKYRKSYKQSQTFKVHDEKNEYAVGDAVRFVECRPISKYKCWRVIGKA